jgi:hypothetical protein
LGGNITGDVTADYGAGVAHVAGLAGDSRQIMLAAGQAGEALLSRRYCAYNRVWPGCDDDHRQFTRTGGTLTWQQAGQQAERLLREHIGEVNAVAAHLVKHRKASRAELYEFFGEPVPPKPTPPHGAQANHAGAAGNSGYDARRIAGSATGDGPNQG